MRWTETNPRWLRPAAGILGVLVISILQFPLNRDTGGLFDYLPIYYGSRALLQTGDAYAYLPSLPDLGTLTEVGNAYPIHAVLLLGLPLAGFPPAVAGFLWVLVVGLLWIGAIAWARESWYWLLWFPMWDALRMQQVSAAIGVASIVALGSLRRGSQVAFLAATVVMAAKPQQTSVLLMVMLWWGRAWWRGLLIAWGSVLVICFAVQPNWVQAWLGQLARRAELVDASWWPVLGVVPVGVWLVHRGWRESGLAVLSTLAAPWPLNGYYVASVWPIGTDRQQSSTFALLGALGLLVTLCSGWYLAFPCVLLLGTAVAAGASPRKQYSLRDFSEADL